MDSLPQMAATLQNLFGPDLERLSRQSGAIRRRRKFSGVILLQMLLFTLLKHPTPKTKHYVATAARLGLTVTERAVQKRFTPGLVAFLRQALQQALQQAVAARRVPTALLNQFTAVRIGDSTCVRLPDDWAGEFPGCGGRSGSGRAVVKLQVLWDLCTGRLIRLVIEPGRRGDAVSAIHEELPPPGSLSIWDLGYFSLRWFEAWVARGASFISRLQPGTATFAPDGRPLDLLERLRRHPWGGPLDLAVVLGGTERLACRLIALRAPQAVVAQRRRKAYEKAQKSGRLPSREHLEWCGWTIFITDCPEGRLSWKEVVVLYRSRWQIELMFKLWKSHNRLAAPAGDRDPVRYLAELWAKLIGALVQHWLLLTTTWLDHRRSLMQAAEVLRDEIGVVMDALGDLDRLIEKLRRLPEVIAAVARVKKRKKKPSWFQLVSDPELLEYSF